MKKILLLFTILLVLGLGACASSPEPYDDMELQDRVEWLEQSNTGLSHKIIELQDEIESLEARLELLEE